MVTSVLIALAIAALILILEKLGKLYPPIAAGFVIARTINFILGLWRKPQAI